jgi:hypothetical protein
MRQERGIDPGSRVAHGQHCIVAVGRQRDVYAVAGIAKLDRVREQVPDNLLQARISETTAARASRDMELTRRASAAGLPSRRPPR